MKLFVRTLAVLVFIGITANGQTLKSVKKVRKPKRIIFLIGDGMGLTQITGAMAGYNGRNAFERFPVTGLSKTSSADNYVTDSGAGATVFSIGRKTQNGSIGVDSAGREIESVFEKLKIKGWGTGVVATSSVTHATPAAFYAHVKSRKSEEEIAEFLLRKSCDQAIGGGAKFFLNRGDKRNLFSELNEKGFKVCADTTFTPISSAKLVYTLAENGMKKMQDGRGNFLSKASETAMNNLKTYYGNYFLMIEGSQIDWGGHDNDYQYMKAELLDFNEVINMVLDMAQKDGNTLVVVTADHETGGLSLLENAKDKSTFIPNYVSKGHSGVMVPVFAFGPGSELFSGIYENTEVYYKFLQLLQLKD